MSPINNIFPEGHGIQSFVATIPHVVKLEDILKPEYWANVAKKLHAHRTHIKANWEDGSRLVELRVVGVELNGAKVRVLQDYDFTKPVAAAEPVVAPTPQTDAALSKPVSSPFAEAKAPAAASTETAADFTVEWKGPSHKHSIIRKSDKQYVKDLFESKAEGEEWLKKYLAGEVKLDAKAA